MLIFDPKKTRSGFFPYKSETCADPCVKSGNRSSPPGSCGRKFAAIFSNRQRFSAGAGSPALR
jgi:hypothetical protein